MDFTITTEHLEMALAADPDIDLCDRCIAAQALLEQTPYMTCGFVVAGNGWDTVAYMGRNIQKLIEVFDATYHDPDLCRRSCQPLLPMRVALYATYADWEQSTDDEGVEG